MTIIYPIILIELITSRFQFIFTLKYLNCTLVLYNLIFRIFQYVNTSIYMTCLYFIIDKGIY